MASNSPTGKRERVTTPSEPDSPVPTESSKQVNIADTGHSGNKTHRVASPEEPDNHVSARLSSNISFQASNTVTAHQVPSPQEPESHDTAPLVHEYDDPATGQVASSEGPDTYVITHSSHNVSFQVSSSTTLRQVASLEEPGIYATMQPKYNASFQEVDDPAMHQVVSSEKPDNYALTHSSHDNPFQVLIGNSVRRVASSQERCAHAFAHWGRSAFCKQPDTYGSSEDVATQPHPNPDVGARALSDSVVLRKKPKIATPHGQPEGLADLMGAQSLQPDSLLSKCPPAQLPNIITASSYMESQKLRRKVPGEREVHAFHSHPWRHLFAPKPAPFVSPYYEANIRADEFEDARRSGYSGLLKGLFSKPNQNRPTPSNKPRVLDAVSPLSIENFRSRHSYIEIQETRNEKHALPKIPETELGDASQSECLVDGLVKDEHTYPVLYRIKTLFGPGVRLESVHIELCLPDRIDLYNITLDQYAVCIKSGKRGFDTSKVTSGDLVWVYSLVPTTKFATSSMALPSDLRDACSPYNATIWRVWRFAFIRHTLEETIGYIIEVNKGKKDTTIKAYMNKSRETITFNKSRAHSTSDFMQLRPDDFIIAPFRDRPLSHMVFCCMHASIDARRELRSHMVDVVYIPMSARVPFDIRRAPQEFSKLLREKRQDFQFIKHEPRRAARFLDDLYSTTSGAIAALISEQADSALYSVVWTPEDINSYPATVNFDIPLPSKSGWAIGNSVQGFYDVDKFVGTISKTSQRDNNLEVTIVLRKWDSLRWRRHALNSRNQRLAVSTCLTLEDDRANPTIALLEDKIITRTFSTISSGWESTKALLASSVELFGQQPNQPEGKVMVRTGKGMVTLNEDQATAIDLFNHRFPMAIVQSAYGAGKTLCATAMAIMAAERGRRVLIASIQNSAIDVIAEKIAQTGNAHIRPVRYISEHVIRDTMSPALFNLAALMETLHETHGDKLDADELDLFKEFAVARQHLREFAFTGTDTPLVVEEHRELLYLERTLSKRLKKLVNIFFHVYKPNIILCTVASALNLTSTTGLFAATYGSWDTVLLDEASMIPEAVLVTLLQRFDKACFTLIGDDKQLPPYVGIQSIPKAVDLCSQSALDVANRKKNIPFCTIRTVYRPHALMMSLNSEVFYNNTLTCGTPVENRMNVLRRISMPNKNIPVAFIDTPSSSTTSATRSHRNEREAEVVQALVSHLLQKGFEDDDISVICLYKDQQILCERTLSGTDVSVGTVDSAQGTERTIVILCTTRTSIGNPFNMSFFTDPRRLNVALSRAREGLFITGSVRCLRNATTWDKILSWCSVHGLIVPADYFTDQAQ